MPSLFLSFMGAVLAGFGGRDYRLVAHLSARFDGSAMVLVLGLASSLITAAVAAFGGSAIASIAGGNAGLMLAALALLWAGLEMIWPWRRALPQEPTRSAFAILAVLLATQIGDAARFLILAMAVATGSAPLTAMGGAIGGCAAIALAWSEAGRALPPALVRRMRMMLGVVLALSGVVLGVVARGIV